MEPQTRQLINYFGKLAMICGLVLFMAYLLTYGTIKEHLRQEHLDTWHTLLPTATTFVPYINKQALENATIILGLGPDKKKVGYVMTSEGRGYGGPIKLLVGISGSKVTGIRILSHTETAGLGSHIMDKDPMLGHIVTFQGQFANKSVFDQFSAHEDIIAITGATITSQGVGDGIQKAVKTYRRLENIQYED